jgi:hypothetical protein
MEPGDRVGRQAAGGERQQRDRGGDDDAVEERRREALDGLGQVGDLLEDRSPARAAREDELEVRQRRRAWQQRPDVGLDRLLRLQRAKDDGRQRQQQEREGHHVAEHQEPPAATREAHQAFSSRRPTSRM